MKKFGSLVICMALLLCACKKPDTDTTISESSVSEETTTTDEETEETTYITPAAATVMSVYWQTVACLYLIWSFLTFAWFISWIIWPVAAIVHAILKKTLSAKND